MITKRLNRGFTVVETIIYATGLVLLIGVMAGMLYYMYNWYQYATISSKVDQIGLTLVDRIVRDVRSGEDIDLGQSSFNVNSGILQVLAKENDISITKRFDVDNGRVRYTQASSTAQYITPANMEIDKMQFAYITTPLSQAIRVELDITYDTRTGPMTHHFYGLGILRQSYE